MTYIINNINIEYISRYYEESIDEQSEQNFIFRNTMYGLIKYLYNNHVLSKNICKSIYEYCFEFDLDDIADFNKAVLFYNLLCYIHIKKIDEEYIECYDYYSLYYNFYTSIESILNLGDIYTLEDFTLKLFHLGYEDEFTQFFKYLNNIDDDDYGIERLHPINNDADLYNLFMHKFECLNRRLYNTNCISTAVFSKMNDYIDNLDVYNDVKFKCAILRYNAYCYILIQTYISGMNNEYDVLYNNFYNTYQDINNLSLEYTPEKIISLYDSGITNDIFIYIFKYINKIDDHPLRNKYLFVENKNIYECNICFNNVENDYFKCKNCVFKICAGCYNNYHLKYNIDKCAHCKV